MRFRSRADAAFERYRASADPRALARLFDLVAPELARVAGYLVRDAHQAEDVLQATFLTVIERREDCAGGEPVLPWLIGIVANRARALRKREGRALDPERLTFPAPSEDPLEAVEQRETSSTLRAALQRLPSPYREVVSLHLLHGMNAAEIAEVLGTPAGSVRTQVVRGLERLRRLLPSSLALHSFLFLPLARPAYLARVREAVCSRAGGQAALTGASFLGGILAMKSLVALGVALVAALAWSLWSLQEREARDATPAGDRSAALLSADRPPAKAAQIEAPAPLPNEPARSPEVAPAAEPMLVVRVLRAASREPAAGIHVHLWPRSGALPELEERHLVTGEDGTAHLDDLDHLADGRWAAQADRGGETLELELARGRTVRAELLLPAGLLVTGTVHDADGRTVDGAELWLSTQNCHAEEGSVVARSDARGRFALRDVAPGRLVAALAEGHLASSCVAAEGEPGATCELELVVPAGAFTLSGVVVDRAGQPIPGATVLAGAADFTFLRMSGTRPAPARYARTDEAGRFALSGFPPASSTELWARAPGRAPWRATIELARPETVTRVELGVGGRVHGRVLEPDGRPVAGERVEVFHFAIEPAEGMAYLGPEWGRHAASTAPDGTFELEELPEGRVRLTVEREGRVATDELEIRDASEQSWTGVLSSPTAIVGVLRDDAGAPLAGWRVYARHDETGARAPPEGTTDERGAFRLEPCDEVEHRLAVTEPGSLAHGPALVVAGVRPSATPLELTVPSSRRASASVTGILRAEEGPLTEGLYVTLVRDAEAGEREIVGGRPRFEGERFVLGPVPPGRYTLHVARDGSPGIDWGEFELAPDSLVDVGTLRLETPGRIALEVRGADGQWLVSERFVLKLPGSDYGDVVSVSGGKGLSRLLDPGRYLLRNFGGATPLFSQGVEVRAGETTTVRLDLPPAVTRRFRFPPMERDAFVRICWRDAAGTILQDGRGTYPSPTGYVLEQHMVPGTYSVEITYPDGKTHSSTFTVDEREEPDAVIDLSP